ncbi:hypothetical protein AB0L63_10345 [Nocardia sp. NPDC051990]|uniref:hypothetical protein n=1 Tax=Nocardia sp. NPDC051990 TaxID=3155285 RepID=UPI00342F450C
MRRAFAKRQNCTVRSSSESWWTGSATSPERLEQLVGEIGDALDLGRQLGRLLQELEQQADDG